MIKEYIEWSRVKISLILSFCANTYRYFIFMSEYRIISFLWVWKPVRLFSTFYSYCYRFSLQVFSILRQIFSQYYQQNRGHWWPVQHWTDVLGLTFSSGPTDGWRRICVGITIDNSVLSLHHRCVNRLYSPPRRH